MIKRLTIENEFGNYVGSNLLDDEALCRGLRFDELNELTDVFIKLGQLEDIEEKLGISLIDLFTSEYCYIIEDNEVKKCKFNFVDSLIPLEILNSNHPDDPFDFVHLPGYRKNWSLNKQDLLDLVGDSND